MQLYAGSSLIVDNKRFYMFRGVRFSVPEIHGKTPSRRSALQRKYRQRPEKPPMAARAIACLPPTVNSLDAGKAQRYPAVSSYNPAKLRV
ncbi:MAG: hypothetical protein H0X43_10360 [Nitrosospira sp.]|nr:hypothetical protein [Nitrosospira sp.]